MAFEVEGMKVETVAEIWERQELEEKKVSSGGAGWYQDNQGRLFHYNGEIWDTVPEELFKELEYLG